MVIFRSLLKEAEATFHRLGRAEGIEHVRRLRERIGFNK
jgi:hypothetical protein